MPPLVSVIIPCYRQAQFLAAAVESALAQDYAAKEVIVVDDDSPDETAAVAAQFGDRIRYLHQRNQGASVARNNGVRAARGEYIALLDADDLCLPGRLAAQAAVLAADPQVGMVASDALHLAGDRLVGLRSVVGGRPRAERFRWQTVEFCATTSTTMIRRECFDTIGQFNEHLHQERWGGEDWLFFVQLSLQYELVYLPFPTVVYRLHGGNGSADLERVNAGNRVACALAVGWERFAEYPAHFRAKLLYYRFATAWRVEPKAAAARYFLRALLTDPAQLPYGLRVIAQGVRNTLNRQRR